MRGTRWAGPSVVLLALTAVGSPGQAAEPGARGEADAKYAEALARLGEADFEGCLQLLAEAEGMATDHLTLAMIRRQTGVVLLVVGRPVEGLLSFVRALRGNPAAQLDPGEHGDDVLALFRCARGFASSPLTTAQIQTRVQTEPDPGRWACPVVPVEPPGGPRPAAGDAPAEPQVPAGPEPGDPAARSPIQPIGVELAGPTPIWPAWLAGGMAVAAGVTGTAFGFDALSKVKARDEASDAQQRSSAQDAAQQSAAGATASFVVMGAAVATAVGWLAYVLASAPGDEVAEDSTPAGATVGAALRF